MIENTLKIVSIKRYSYLHELSVPVSKRKNIKLILTKRRDVVRTLTNCLDSTTLSDRNSSKLNPVGVLFGRSIVEIVFTRIVTTEGHKMSHTMRRQIEMAIR